MFKKFGKNLRNVCLFIKSSVFEQKRKGDILKKSGLVGVKIREKDGNISYELANMQMDHFGMEIYYYTHDSKRKIYEHEKSIYKPKIEDYIPIQRVIQMINSKYGKEIINTYLNGLSKNELKIIKKELPYILR